MMTRKDRTMSLADALESERNGFNLVRLGAAMAVLVSHSVALLYGDAYGEPLSSVTPYTLGQHAVNVFFVLSGLMLSRSWALRPDLARFVQARLLRIFPGLFACGMVTAFVLAPLAVGSPAAYFSDNAPYLYPLRILYDFSRARLDGVFVNASLYSGSINDSLWTIKYELAAYLLFAAAAAGGLVRRKTFAVALLLAATAVITAGDIFDLDQNAVVPAGRFAMSFALGVAAFLFRERVPLSWPWLAGLLALAVALHTTALALPACILATAYLAIYLGSFRPHGTLAWAQRSDLSYGLYLYAWPVQQLLLALVPAIGLLPHMAASLVGASLLAFASWRLVEAPALRLKSLIVPQPLARPA